MENWAGVGIEGYRMENLTTLSQMSRLRTNFLGMKQFTFPKMKSGVWSLWPSFGTQTTLMMTKTRKLPESMA